MFKKVIRRIRINFRTSRSDRSGTESYRNYHMRMRGLFNKANVFRRFKK